MRLGTKIRSKVHGVRLSTLPALQPVRARLKVKKEGSAHPGCKILSDQTHSCLFYFDCNRITVKVNGYSWKFYLTFFKGISRLEVNAATYLPNLELLLKKRSYFKNAFSPGMRDDYFPLNFSLNLYLPFFLSVMTSMDHEAFGTLNSRAMKVPSRGTIR